MDSEIIIRVGRVGDAAPIARVHVDTWRSAYRNLIPDEILAGLSYELRARFWRGQLSNPDFHGYLYVAEHPQSGIVGFASGGPNRDAPNEFQGELYAIYILDRYQRRGVGRRLFQRAARWLWDKGFHSMIVWVLEANPSRAFYESLGGALVAKRDISIRGARLTEVGYGWRDLSLSNLNNPM